MTSEQLQARMQARTPKLKIAVLGAIPLDPRKLIKIVEEKLASDDDLLFRCCYPNVLRNPIIQQSVIIQL